MKILPPSTATASTPAASSRLIITMLLRFSSGGASIGRIKCSLYHSGGWFLAVEVSAGRVMTFNWTCPDGRISGKTIVEDSAAMMGYSTAWPSSLIFGTARIFNGAK